MGQRASIDFDLLGNAKDSLRRAVELLAWKDISSDHPRLKHAIMNVTHCIELLLKERIRRINPSLVWENVDRYPSLDARTVTVDAAIGRLRRIGNVVINEQDEKTLKSIRLTRNAIEHFEWQASEAEVKTILGTALNFVFSFAKRELDLDLSRDFRKDDTWNMLLNELYEFAKAHGRRIESELASRKEIAVFCDQCGAETVSVQNGSCELCGHWKSVDLDDE